MLILKYEGGDADQHRIDALTGGESLEGLGRAVSLVSHYVATGEVRQRAPYSREARFLFTANRAGSLEWLLQYVQNNPGEIAVDLGINGITALVGWLFAKAVGGRSAAVPASVTDLDEARSGDLEALVEAIEPSLRKAHRVIGPSVQQILIINGNNNNVMLNFDHDSKEYLEEDIDGGRATQDVSIASLNVNSRYGRAYFFDLRRTVPFKIDRYAHGRTITQLSRALDNYAKKNGIPVEITFTRVLASDDRLKRIIIHDALSADEAEEE